MRRACGVSQALVKTVDMTEEMEKDVLELAATAIVDYMSEKDMADHIRREMDKKYKCALSR